MSDHHPHPIIWDVLDAVGARISTLVAETYEIAVTEAAKLYGAKVGSVVDTGKRKPPGKCCDHCGLVPCGTK